MFTNTGTKTLHGVTVVDTLTTLTCVPATPVATLAPGGHEPTCTGTYVVTQADIDNNGNPNPDGFIHNVATGALLLHRPRTPSPTRRSRARRPPRR